MKFPDTQSAPSEMDAYSESNGIPNNAPTVVMDIRLGEKYDHVGFDYGAYSRLAERLGIAESGSSDLNIHITSALKIIDGSYYPEERTVTLKAIPGLINKNLTHELQHAADHYSGTLKRDIRFYVGNIAAYFSLPLAAASVASAPAAVYAENNSNHLLVTSYCSVFAATMIASVSTLYGYTLHPNERRARNASRQNIARVISLLPSPRA
jgi:hypothetical protein